MSANSSTSISEPYCSWRSPLLALCTSALIVVACGTVNWAVDPFNRYGRNQLGVYSSSERDAKPQMIRDYPHDGIIIGSSRVTYTDPASVRGYHLFNAGFSAAMPEEMLNFLRLFAFDQKLVIVGLDFLMFNEREFPIAPKSFEGISPIDTAPKSITVADVVRARDYFLSSNVFAASIRTLVVNATTEREPPFLMPAGNRNAEHLLKADVGAERDYSETITYWREHILFDYRFSNSRLDVLRQIKALLEQRHIPYIVFINPENERLMDLIKNMGLYQTDVAFRNAVTAIFPNAVDLTESKWASPDYFFAKDPGHYRPEFGAAMINDMIAARPDLKQGQKAVH